MRGRLKIEIADAGNGDVFLQNNRVRFARADKAVALQDSTTTSQAQKPTYLEVLRAFTHYLSVDEHRPTIIMRAKLQAPH